MLEYFEGGLEAGAESECSDRGATGVFGATGPGKKLRPASLLQSKEVSPSPFYGNANGLVLQFLFLEPNASDPLNKEAAEDLRSNREGFKRNVRTSMSGGAVKGQQYERVIMKGS